MTGFQQDIESRTEEEMIGGVRSLLLDAVRDRLRADVPVGIFLSGGIDSSAIAGIVKHLMETEGAELGSSRSHLINCFSIKFFDEQLDEEGML
jgi:asparagine synthase (glutamine-hydrolysing)